MEDASPLQALAIVERDREGVAMVVWSFPKTSAEQDAVFVARSDFSTEVRAVVRSRGAGRVGGMGVGRGGATWAVRRGAQALTHRLGKQWVYAASTTASLPSRVLPGVSGVSLHLCTRTFHPERWCALAAVLLERYTATGDPRSALTAWYEAFRSRRVAESGWEESGWSDSSAFVGGGRLAGVARLLGDHLVLAWTALLLRRRVVVLAPTAGDVLGAVRGLLLLLPHRGRGEWAHARPLVSSAVLRTSAAAVASAERGGGGDESSALSAIDSDPAVADDESQPLPERLARAAARAEVKDLLSAGYYLAGTTDEGFAARPDLWDCLVDLRGRRVQPSPSEVAAGTFTLTPLHRAVAESAARALAGEAPSPSDTDSSSPSSASTPHESADVRVAKAVAAVTKDMIAKVAAIAEAAPRGVLTPTALADAGVKPPMLAVLWEVAKAEPSIPTAVVALALSEDEARRKAHSLAETDAETDVADAEHS
jgi:hypothetical protein